MKWQWEIFLPSRDEWWNFYKLFDTDKEAIEWSNKSKVFIMARDDGYKFRLIGINL